MIETKTVTLRQAVERLARDGTPLSYYTLKRLVDEGKIPCQKIGRKYILLYENIVNFLRGVPHVRSSANIANQDASNIRRVDTN